jgi:hypothetical protein
MARQVTTDRTIRAGEVYGKDEFLERSGIRQHAFRMAKRNGLRTVPIHGRVFIRGEDWLAYLDKAIRQHEQASS